LVSEQEERQISRIAEGRWFGGELHYRKGGLTEPMKKRVLRATLVPGLALVLLALVCLLLGTSAALADDTGWNDPSANAIDSGGGFISPTYAYHNDTDRASLSSLAGVAGHIYSGYGLNVPDCATIDGIEVRLDYWISEDTDATTVTVELYNHTDGSWTAAEIDTSRPLTETTVLFGGSTDKWGTTWTPTDTNDSDFQVRVICDTDG
jgi:hypothetical protein